MEVEPVVAGTGDLQSWINIPEDQSQSRSLLESLDPKVRKSR